MDQSKLSSLMTSLIEHADGVLKPDSDTLNELVKKACPEGNNLVFRPDEHTAIGIREDGLFLMDFAIENGNGNTIEVARIEPDHNFTIVARTGEESFVNDADSRDLNLSDLRKLLGKRDFTVH